MTDDDQTVQPSPVEPAPTAPAFSLPPPVVNVVDADTPCIVCSYNLRGQRRNGRCPECGTAVARTLAGNLLRFASAEYLQAIARGLQLVIWGTIAKTVLSIMGGITGAALSFMAATQGAGMTMQGVVMIGAALGGTLLTLVVVAGWLMVSIEDPGIAGTNRGSRARQVVRICAVLSGVGTVIGNLLLFVGPTPMFATGTAGGAIPGATALSLTSLLIMSGSQMAAGLAGIVLFFGSIIYARWLAARVPDPNLVRQSGLYLWLLPVLYVFGSCVIVGPLIAAILYLIYLFTLRRHVLAALAWQASPQAREIMDPSSPSTAAPA